MSVLYYRVRTLVTGSGRRRLESRSPPSALYGLTAREHRWLRGVHTFKKKKRLDTVHCKTARCAPVTREGSSSFAGSLRASEDGRRFSGRIPTDMPDPPFRARPIPGAAFKVGARRDHLIGPCEGNHLCEVNLIDHVALCGHCLA